MRPLMNTKNMNKLIQEYGEKIEVYQYELNGQVNYAKHITNNSIFDEALTKVQAYDLLIEQFSKKRKYDFDSSYFLPGTIEFLLDSQNKRL